MTPVPMTPVPMTPVPMTPVPSKPVPLAGRLITTVLTTALVWAALLMTALLAPPAGADTPWGQDGAAFSGGIVCTLPGDVTVPMARWAVDGASVFATADVFRTGTQFSPAPSQGAALPAAPGQGGFTAADIGAAAYLIAHHGSGSAVDTAQTSADIAAITGFDEYQPRCLGQQGTSAAKAAALWSQAERLAGPYTVTVTAVAARSPGARPGVSALVTSVAGAATPGVAVTFTAAGGAVVGRAETGADGAAATTLPAAAVPTGAAQAQITATISEPTGLSYYSSTPPSVAAAPPSTFTGTVTVTAPRPPQPVVTVTGLRQLQLRRTPATVVASVTGTQGYSGSGTAQLTGPVQPAAGQPCTSLVAGDFAAAPVAWTGTLTFRGDGTRTLGATHALDPGCYAGRADVTTTNSTPPVHAVTSFAAQSTITVSTLTLAETIGRPVVPAGPLSATVTASDPGSASVTAAITAYGPLPPRAGRCSTGLHWSRAAAGSRSAGVALSSASSTAPGATAGPTPNGTAPNGTAPNGTPLSATVAAAAVTRPGCYALRAHSTVSQDGLTTAVDTPIGSAGSTVLVAAPTITVADADYDGQQGKPMTGSLTVLGSYRFAGTAKVGLVPAPRPPDGCHAATFAPAGVPARTATVTTSGDGSYAFRTPAATGNTCYAVTATLSLTANPAVTATTPPPTTASVFLAGVASTQPPLGVAHARVSTGWRQSLVAAVVAGGLVLLAVLSVLVRAIAARRHRDEPAGAAVLRLPRATDDDDHDEHDDGPPSADRPSADAAVTNPPTAALVGV